MIPNAYLCCSEELVKAHFSHAELTKGWVQTKLLGQKSRAIFDGLTSLLHKNIQCIPKETDPTNADLTLYSMAKAKEELALRVQ